MVSATKRFYAISYWMRPRQVFVVDEQVRPVQHGCVDEQP
jgi:hypothetical protein